jgi:hypothetical protein
MSSSSFTSVNHMDERVQRLYAVNGVEPQDDDVCLVDTRTRSLVQGGMIWRAGAGEALASQLNRFVDSGRVFKTVPTVECGEFTTRASRVIKTDRHT